MSRARITYQTQQDLVSQLIEIHKASQPETKSRNKYSAQDKYYALSRAGVVFSVAAWQAYAENVVIEVYDKVEGEARQSDNCVLSWANRVLKINHLSLYETLKYFNTPNSENVRNLFKRTLDFDPHHVWNEWQHRSEEWEAIKISKITDFWLDVRHTVAHGSSLPKDIRNGPNKNKEFNLNYFSLMDCRNHFNFLTDITDSAIHKHIQDNLNLTLED